MSEYRILLLEDEPMIRSVVADLLRSKGHHVEEAGDGERAIERFEQATEAGAPFDLAILDLTLPGEITGQQVLAHCRERRADLGVIIASGYADETEIQVLCAGERTELLSKPYNMGDLLSLAARMLEA
jgi:CheY-like chemotaxis protein